MPAPIHTAMLLAAGRGTRLAPLTDLRPKPLIPLGCAPMVAQVLERLAAHGIQNVHMNTHHLGEKIPPALGDGRDFGLTITYHHEPTLLGTGGGLLNAATTCPELAKAPLLMINADVLCDVNLGAVMAQHIDTAPIATLVLRPDAKAAEFGILAYDHLGKIRRFLDLKTGAAANERMFTGIQVISPKLFDYMPKNGGPFPITNTYRAAMSAGETLLAYDHHGYWNDLGTPERLMQAEMDLVAGKINPPGDEA